MSPATEVNIGSLKLKNPVMPASGTFDWLGEDVSPDMSPGNLGAIVTKSITVNPQRGNPPQRIAETSSGMLNTIGIPSVGLESFLRDYLPRYEVLQTSVIVSIQAYTPQECERLVRELSRQPRVDAIEINLSCPNLGNEQIIAQSPGLTSEVVAAGREASDLPLIAKLSPNVSNMSEIARAAQDAGADALCVMNTLRGMAVDISTRRALLANVGGGLSGPAIKPVALYMLWECYREVEIPILGSGGICSTQDALEFFLAGAQAIQVGTATFRDPRTMNRIVHGIQDYLRDNGVREIGELTGGCHRTGNLYAG